MQRFEAQLLTWATGNKMRLKSTFLWSLLAIIFRTDSISGLQGLTECPKANDKIISACLTRVFRAELLPRLATGSPEFGIQSIEPVIWPNLTFPVLDLPFYRLTVELRNIVVRGGSDIRPVDLTWSTANQWLEVDLKIPKLTGLAELSLGGRRFGIPSSVLTKRGLLRFKISELAMRATFTLENAKTENESLRFVHFESERKDFEWEIIRVIRSQFVENLVNRLLYTFRNQFYERFVKRPFEEIFAQVVDRVITKELWTAVLGEYI